MSWSELPAQFQRFAWVLRRERSTKDTAHFIYREAGRFSADWKHGRQLTASLLPIPVPRDQGLHPTGCRLLACYLAFQFNAADNDELPLRAEYQVRVEGILVTGSGSIELEDHWRIDSDTFTSPTSDADSPGAGNGREPHPSFHFQRGGHAQDAFAEREGFVPGRHTDLGEGEWKGLMQYRGPRIASLPFDPILAIDFCIAQNDGPLWKRLRNVSEYGTLVRTSQERLWTPFLESLSERAGRRRWLGPLIVV